MSEPLLKMGRGELIAGLGPTALVMAAAAVMYGRFAALGSTDDGRYFAIGWIPGGLAAIVVLAAWPSRWSLVVVAAGAVAVSLLHVAGWCLTPGTHPPTDRLIHAGCWLLTLYAGGVGVPLLVQALPTARRLRARAELRAREAAARRDARDGASRRPPCPPGALVRGAAVGGLLLAAAFAGLLLLLERWSSDVPIASAASRGDRVALGRAIRRGEDLDAPDDRRAGLAPLHHAAMGGQTACVEMLLRAGANPNVRDQNGWTPLHCARHSTDDAIYRALVRAGADPNARDHLGCTPLHYASLYGDAATCRLLLAVGADPNVRDGTGKTPTDYVRERGDPEVLAAFGLAGASSGSGG